MVSKLSRVCVAAALVAIAAPSFAQSAADKETARSLMDQGDDLRTKGDLIYL